MAFGRRKDIDVLGRVSSLIRRALPGAIGGLIVLTALSVTGVLGNNHETIFYACIENRSGTMYAFSQNAPPRCKIGDQYVSWGQVGPQGEQGLQGIPGVPGISEAEYVQSAPENLTSNTRFKTLVAECPAGKVPIAGGMTRGDMTWVTADGPPISVLTDTVFAGSSPNPYGIPAEPGLVSPDSYAWVVEVLYGVTGGNIDDVRATALCAVVDPVQ